MESKTDVSADVNERRVASLTRGADLTPVAELLRERGDEILARWLEIARQQPFHHRRPDRAVTDHLPHLLEGVVALLERTAPPTAQPAAPLDDDRVNDAARESPADIVAAELIVNDALDGATAMTMHALSNRVEEVRADFLATTLHDADSRSAPRGCRSRWRSAPWSGRSLTSERLATLCAVRCAPSTG